MTRKLIAALTVSIMLVLTGCGDSNPPPSFSTRILSTVANDGDISVLNSVGQVTQGSQVNPANLASVFAGIDAATGTEFRAFLDFSLSGSSGVPRNAIIDSATLDIYIDSLAIQPAANSVPIRIDLVSFPPNPLLVSDFNGPILATKRTFILRSDVNHHVRFDVTGLMAVAQAQVPSLLDFQVRISEDIDALPDGAFDGLVEIHEATVQLAPHLEVIYH
jgi:hypothetical protein